MFDVGISHLVVIAIVGILVLGPEKLPGFVRDAARMWRMLRGLAADAQDKITGEIIPEVADEVRALPPRKLVRHLLLGDETVSSTASSRARTTHGPEQTPSRSIRSVAQEPGPLPRRALTEPNGAHR